MLLAAACGSGEPAVSAAPGSPADSAPVLIERSTATPAAVASPRPARPFAACLSSPAVRADGDLLRVIDKEQALPDGFAPGALSAAPLEWLVPSTGGQRLRPDALGALLDLLREAQAVGHELRLRSAYRSFDVQVGTFAYWVELLGEEQAQRESARAGHSEHQLGSTVDIASASVGWELIAEFGSTPEGRWLADNAARYGFALSYPRDGEEVTGYVYEPWHFRYIGVTCARQWAGSGLTLVEFLRRAEAAASR